MKPADVRCLVIQDIGNSLLHRSQEWNKFRRESNIEGEKGVTNSIISLHISLQKVAVTLVQSYFTDTASTLSSNALVVVFTGTVDAQPAVCTRPSLCVPHQLCPLGIGRGQVLDSYLLNAVMHLRMFNRKRI